MALQKREELDMMAYWALRSRRNDSAVCWAVERGGGQGLQEGICPGVPKGHCRSRFAQAWSGVEIYKCGGTDSVRKGY